MTGRTAVRCALSVAVAMAWSGCGSKDTSAPSSADAPTGARPPSSGSDELPPERPVADVTAPADAEGPTSTAALSSPDATAPPTEPDVSPQPPVPVDPPASVAGEAMRAWARERASGDELVDEAELPMDARAELSRLRTALGWPEGELTWLTVLPGADETSKRSYLVAWQRYKPEAERQRALKAAGKVKGSWEREQLLAIAADSGERLSVVRSYPTPYLESLTRVAGRDVDGDDVVDLLRGVTVSESTEWGDLNVNRNLFLVVSSRHRALGLLPYRREEGRGRFSEGGKNEVWSWFKPVHLCSTVVDGRVVVLELRKHFSQVPHDPLKSHGYSSRISAQSPSGSFLEGPMSLRAVAHSHSYNALYEPWRSVTGLADREPRVEKRKPESVLDELAPCAAPGGQAAFVFPAPSAGGKGHPREGAARFEQVGGSPPELDEHGFAGWYLVTGFTFGGDAAPAEATRKPTEAERTTPVDEVLRYVPAS